MAKIDWGRLRAAVGGHVAEGELPGVIMAASQGGDVRVETVGTALPGGVALAPDAVVRISSMTKALTGALAMALVEEGALGPGDRVDRWIPELADRRVLRRVDGPPEDTVPADRPVTVEDLLTMRMGFGFVTDSACPVLDLAAQAGLGIGPPDPANPLTPDAWIARFAKLPLMQQPGADWMYDLAYGVLGVVLARAAGRPLDELMQDRLLGPLGMEDTGFAAPQHALERLIPCYTRDDEGRLVEFDAAAGASRWAARPAFPDARGGLVSTVTDYLRFARMLLAGGLADDGTRVLAEESVAALTRDQLGPGQPRSANARAFLGENGWGYGVEVITAQDSAQHTTEPRTLHYGWGGGLGTTWYSFPALDLAVVLVTQFFPPPGPVIDAFWSALHEMIGA